MAERLEAALFPLFLLGSGVVLIFRLADRVDRGLARLDRRPGLDRPARPRISPPGEMFQGNAAPLLGDQHRLRRARNLWLFQPEEHPGIDGVGGSPTLAVAGAVEDAGIEARAAVRGGGAALDVG